MECEDGELTEQDELLANLEDPQAALRSLVSFARAMLRQNTVEDLVWEIADQMGRLLQFEDCVLYLCEPHGLVQVAAFGVKNPRRHEIQSPITIAYGDGIVGTVAVTGRAERIGDVRADPRYIEDEFAGLSELTVPIVFEGEVIGVLDSENSCLDGYTETDETLATAVASIAAPRIASALAAEENEKTRSALAVAEEGHRRLEEDRRVERIESLGVLAGGIAHDFNNLLTAILGNLCLAQLDPGAPETAELLAEAERACERASALTLQLLTFSKGGMPVKESGDLSGLLRESVEFALRGFNVAAEYDLADDLGTVAMDRDQMAHVFHNLVLNAAQAMGGDGRLLVTARRQTDGSGVEVRVRDEGPGVPPALAARIFEPYFSTREGGNGLGLASAHSIVRRHGGRLDLETAEGPGACFIVRLPGGRTSEEAPRDGDDDWSVPASRVLVLDDDKAARTAIVKMLESLGHQVVGVEEGGRCIELYEEAMASESPFDAVVMDLAIPGGMGGREAIRRLRAIDSDVRAIVVSGYSEDPILSDPEHFGFRGRIRKPFRMDALERELGRVLRD